MVQTKSLFLSRYGCLGDECLLLLFVELDRNILDVALIHQHVFATRREHSGTAASKALFAVGHPGAVAVVSEKEDRHRCHHNSRNCVDPEAVGLRLLLCGLDCYLSWCDST